jgi:DNA-binding transcriptional LysR family regulator
MEVKDIEYVKAILDHGSLTKASEALYITQPSLSMYIKSMESRLGVKIFSQVGKKFELTYAGEKLMAAGREILFIRDNFNNELSSILNNDYGRLKVAIPILRSSYLIPAIIPKFNEIYPNVEIELVEDYSVVLEEKIINGEADIGILNKPNRELNLDYEVISDEEFLLAVPENHPLVNTGITMEGTHFKWIDIRQFENDRFILHFPEQRTGQLAKKIFEERAMKPKNIFRTRSIETALNLTSVGFGISFISESHIHHIQLSKTPCFFSIGNPTIKFGFIAAYRKNLTLPPYAKAFIEICKNQIY